MKMVGWTIVEMVELWLLKPMKMAGLNAYENGGSERLLKWWLWMPMKMMGLNAYENDGGYEHILK